MEEKDDKYILNKPWKYKKNWLIFPNTIYDNIEISNCENTINGVCIDNKTIEECIKLCNGDNCSHGYHIQFKDGKSICLPLKTNDLNINPVRRLRKQYIYPEFNNVNVSSFIDINKFPYPSKQSNIVFYHDILNILNIGTKLTLGGSKYITEDGNITGFSNEKALNITILPLEIKNIQISKYLPLKYGDYFNINIPSTTLLLTIGEYRSLIWKQIKGLTQETYAKFQIYPIDKNKKEGDVVMYSDIFTIRYNDIDFLTIDKYNNNFFITPVANYDAKRATAISYPYFSFISKMTGYYCENGICKSVPISNINKDGTYKGFIVGKEKECQGRCSYTQNNTNNLMYSIKSPPYERHILIRNIIVSIGIFTIILLILINKIFIN
jgi:hypothetical protein